MKILAFYHDDNTDLASPAGTLRWVVKQQAAIGHRATVFTSPRPVTSGWRLVRSFNLAWFFARALLHAVTNQYDVIIAGNRPHVLLGILLRTIHALRGTPYIYVCHVLYPELALVERGLKYGRQYSRLLRWDTAACRAARSTVVPSRDMAETLVAHGVPAERISVIQDHADYTSTSRSGSSTLAQYPPGTAKFLFVGELNRSHGLERLIAAARLVAARVPFQLVFMGEGPAKSELVELAGDLVGRRIVFLPPQSPDIVATAMRDCDYGIVSLTADAHRFTYPRECGQFGSAGCPVIALIEPQSELAQSIVRHKLGCVGASRSVTGIAETILQAVGERSHWTADRRSQLETSCQTLFGSASTQQAWHEIIAGAAPHTIVMPRSGPASKAA